MEKFLKYFLVSLLFFAIAMPLKAQITTQDETNPQPGKQSKRQNKSSEDKDDQFWSWSKFYVGGIPGFGISDYYLTVSVAAEAGYFVHPHIALGWETDYSYVDDKTYPPFDFKYNVIRFGPYARGYIWKGIFAQAQYQLTTIKNFEQVDESTSPPTIQTTPHLNNNALLLGAGYHDHFENGFGFYFAILFNVINASSSLTTNPEFELGLTYRFKKGEPQQRRQRRRNVGAP